METQFDQQDVSNNKAMSVLAYLGILVLIPIFAAKDSPYAKFHANQGLVLFIVEIVFGTGFRVLSYIPGVFVFGIFTSLVSFAIGVLTLVLAIMGIVAAANGEAKKLPVIGTITILQ